jgi:hypothetical protein
LHPGKNRWFPSASDKNWWYFRDLCLYRDMFGLSSVVRARLSLDRAATLAGGAASPSSTLRLCTKNAGCRSTPQVLALIFCQSGLPSSGSPPFLTNTTNKHFLHSKTLLSVSLPRYPQVPKCQPTVTRCHKDSLLGSTLGTREHTRRGKTLYCMHTTLTTQHNHAHLEPTTATTQPHTTQSNTQQHSHTHTHTHPHSSQTVGANKNLLRILALRLILRQLTFPAISHCLVIPLPRHLFASVMGSSREARFLSTGI